MAVLVKKHNLLHVKLEISDIITRIITFRGMTQEEVALTLNTQQSKVSLITSGKVYSFSLERLLRFLNLLGFDVHIKIIPFGELGETRVLDFTLPEKDNG